MCTRYAPRCALTTRRFWQDASRGDVETILRHYQHHNGLFLVRQSGTVQFGMALSCVYDGDITHHLLIRERHGLFSVNDMQIPAVRQS